MSTEEPKEVKVEIDIRGRFIMMAIDIEWTMLRIIMACANDPSNQSHTFYDKKMANKIELTISVLKKHKPQYYLEYKDDLDKLIDFKDMRNDLAHYKLIFDKDHSFKEFKFYFIAKNDKGEDQIFYKIYSYELLATRLKEYRNLELKLAELSEKLMNDLPAKFREGFVPSF